jgi:xylulokinase
MRELGVPILRMCAATGGGGKSPLWRQMQADIYNAPSLDARRRRGAAYGAALLAGVGTGHFADVNDAVNRCVRVVATTQPDPTTVAKYDQIYAIYRTMYNHLSADMHALANL